jgi:hypothetical protein
MEIVRTAAAIAGGVVDLAGVVVEVVAAAGRAVVEVVAGDRDTKGGHGFARARKQRKGCDFRRGLLFSRNRLFVEGANCEFSLSILASRTSALSPVRGCNDGIRHAG